jgi:hypothetical protein
MRSTFDTLRRNLELHGLLQRSTTTTGTSTTTTTATTTTTTTTNNANANASTVIVTISDGVPMHPAFEQARSKYYLHCCAVGDSAGGPPLDFVCVVGSASQLSQKRHSRSNTSKLARYQRGGNRARKWSCSTWHPCVCR